MSLSRWFNMNTFPTLIRSTHQWEISWGRDTSNSGAHTTTTTIDICWWKSAVDYMPSRVFWRTYTYSYMEKALYKCCPLSLLFFVKAGVWYVSMTLYNLWGLGLSLIIYFVKNHLLHILVVSLIITKLTSGVGGIADRNICRSKNKLYSIIKMDEWLCFNKI